ncbi:hypothetical protein ABY45_14600 [Microbacterium maritypicum]|uniref:hypothetical protein n=1 Tax=Microbacterium maritypicum TaxID=33918 RepID=UPI003D6E0D0F
MRVSKRTVAFVRIWVPRLRAAGDGIVLAYFTNAYSFFAPRYAHVMTTLALREINRRARRLRAERRRPTDRAGGVR